MQYILHKIIDDKKNPVMRKKKQYNPPDPDLSCTYCGATVPKGEGFYTLKNKLLICRKCNPLFFTPLHKIRPTKVKMLESSVC